MNSLCTVFTSNLAYAIRAACLIALLALLTIGCRTQQRVQEPAPPAITSVRVGSFQCDNRVTAEAVRNVFIEVFARNRHVKVVRDGGADVVVEGTVTLAAGGSTSKDSSVTGTDYVSGVTALVMRDGAIVTSASWGQVIAQGEELLPPELVARKAADRLMSALYGKGLQKR